MLWSSSLCFCVYNRIYILEYIIFNSRIFREFSRYTYINCQIVDVSFCSFDVRLIRHDSYAVHKIFQNLHSFVMFHIHAVFLLRVRDFVSYYFSIKYFRHPPVNSVQSPNDSDRRLHSELFGSNEACPISTCCQSLKKSSNNLCTQPLFVRFSKKKNLTFYPLLLFF